MDDGVAITELTERSRESSLDGWAKVVCIGFAVGCLVEVICFLDALGWLFGGELWLPLSVRNAATFVVVVCALGIWHLRRLYHGPDRGIEGTLTRAQATGLLVGSGVVLILIVIANAL